MVRDRVLVAFKEALDLEDPVDTSTLVYRDFEKWTSMVHLTLIAILEEDFDAMLETDDVLNMSDFEKAVEIMSKYDSAAA